MKRSTKLEYLGLGVVLGGGPVMFALWASAHPIGENLASLGWLLFGCANVILLAFARKLAARSAKRYRLRSHCRPPQRPQKEN